jgi:DNA-binding LacI/PurR family transcriptional regulator
MPKKIKLPRGAQARIARECGVSAVTVCLVLKGKRKSVAVTEAIRRELEAGS